MKCPVNLKMISVGDNEDGNAQFRQDPNIPYQLVISSLTIVKICCVNSPDYSYDNSDMFEEEDSFAKVTKKLDLSYSLESNFDSDFSIQQTTEEDQCATEPPEVEEMNLFLIINENATQLISCDSVEFVDLVERSKYVVDKTASIRPTLEDPSAILLLTAPRKWGKTVTLTMFKTFLEIQTHRNDTKTVNVTETSNYQLFKHGRLPNGDQLRDPPTAISEDEELIDEYLGQYPVIYISFRGVGKGVRNGKIFRGIIKNKISDVFRAYEYLLNSYKKIVNDYPPGTDIRKKAKTNAKVFESFMNEEASDDEYLTSLNRLSAMLHDYFDKKVFLLIDDYDSPIVDIIQHDKFPFKEDTLEYYYDLLKETIGKNKNLEKAIVVGIFSLGKKRIFSRPKSSKLKELSVLDNELFSYVGVNENELSSLYRKMPSAAAHEISRRYNSFRAGLDDSAKAVNPWSICMHLNDQRAFKPIYEYDEPAGSMDEMLPVFMKNKYFEDALTALSLRSDYNMTLPTIEITIPEFEEIQNFTTVPHYNATSVALALKYLLICGYLTFSPSSESGENVTLTIPNAEMHSRLENHTIPHFVQHLSYETSRQLKTEVTILSDHFLKFVKNNDSNPSKLEKYFTHFLNKMPPFRGAGQKKMTKNTIRPTFHNIGSIINCFVFLDRNHFDLSVVRFETINETCLFIFVYESRGIIVETKYGPLDRTNTKNYPLQEVKWNNLRDIFQQPPFVDQVTLVKLLGIRVNPTKQVDMCVKIEFEKPAHVKPNWHKRGEPRSFASDEYDEYDSN